jgi:hypothetical protein
VEYFRIPRDVLTMTVGKSTYARCGIITNVTPFEPEWEGHVTLEISNTTPLPAKIYANEGIAQVLFCRATSPPTCPTGQGRKVPRGKYQRRAGRASRLPNALSGTRQPRRDANDDGGDRPAAISTGSRPARFDGVGAAAIRLLVVEPAGAGSVRAVAGHFGGSAFVRPWRRMKSRFIRAMVSIEISFGHASWHSP